MLNNIKSGAGFTLLEVLIAIFLLTFGIGGAFILINQTMVSSQLTSSRLQASYLVQEGIEIVRNIRDSNFLKVHKGIAGADWLAGLTACAPGCEADFNDTNLVVFSDRYLKIGGGFFNYDSGQESSFKRKITISDLTDLSDPPDGLNDRIKVLVEVSWLERGRSHKVTAQELLYRWW